MPDVAFEFSDFQLILQLVSTFTLVIAGFLFTAFGLRFRYKVSNEASSKSINLRNDFRILIMHHFIYVGILLTSFLVISALLPTNLTDNYVRLFLVIIALAIIAYFIILLVRTYQFIHKVTSMDVEMSFEENLQLLARSLNTVVKSGPEPPNS
jgi:amino acid permease